MVSVVVLDSGISVSVSVLVGIFEFVILFCLRLYVTYIMLKK